MRRLLVLSLAGALIAASASAALAARTHVPPGAGTLQAAIDAAAPGDTLVAAGVYTGPVVINKRLNIVIDKHAPLPGIQIDVECAAPVGLTISADKVTTKGGPIAVFGATTTGIVVDGTTRSKFFTLTALETCGTATTGLLIRSTTGTRFSGGNIFDFKGTAIRVEDMPLAAKVKVWGFQGSGSPTGLAITNVADGAARKGAALSFRDVVSGVGNGVVLTNADGVVIELSSLNAGISGTSVTIDAASANNVMRLNGVSTVIDEGVDTCWKGNNGYPDSCP